jgi:hypothetical protein
MAAMEGRLTMPNATTTAEATFEPVIVAARRAQAAVETLERARLAAVRAFNELAGVASEAVASGQWGEWTEHVHVIARKAEDTAAFIEHDGDGSCYPTSYVQRVGEGIVGLAEHPLLAGQGAELGEASTAFLECERQFGEDPDV